MMKMFTKKRNKKGFTLIELVVVIAILGVLASIAVPKLSGFRHNAAFKADIATAKLLATAGATWHSTNPGENIGDPTNEDEFKVLIPDDLSKNKYKTQLDTEDTFTVYIGIDGTVTVKAGTLELFPAVPVGIPKDNTYPNS